jgi:hypothetical protein
VFQFPYFFSRNVHDFQRCGFSRPPRPSGPTQGNAAYRQQRQREPPPKPPGMIDIPPGMPLTSAIRHTSSAPVGEQVPSRVLLAYGYMAASHGWVHSPAHDIDGLIGLLVGLVQLARDDTYGDGGGTWCGSRRFFSLDAVLTPCQRSRTCLASPFSVLDVVLAPGGAMRW